jgi:xylulokinase
VDDEGSIRGISTRTYQLFLPAPGRVEADPEEVWSACVGAIASVARRASRLGLTLQALAVSASVDESVFVDADGHPIGRVIMAPDTRSSSAFRAWLDDVGPAHVYAITGLPAYPAHVLPRLLWLRQHQASRFGRVRLALDWAAFVAARLGLAPTSDPSVAARTMAWDFTKGTWSAELLDRAGLVSTLLPGVEPAGSPIGEVPRNVALRLGLPAGIVLVAGGMDQALAAVGTGSVDPGQAMVGTGTWEALTVPILPSPSSGESLRASGISIGPFVDGPGLIAMATQIGGGALLSWFQRVIAPDRSVGSLLRSAPVRPTGLLVQPHAEGSLSPWMDPASTMAIAGIGLATDRGELLRAVLEGICFELRENLSRIESSGTRVEALRASGGGAQSAAWVQLKADVLGRPVATVNIAHNAAFGAALLAGSAVGLYGPVRAAARQLVRITRVFEPRPAFSRAYDEIFERYRQLYPALRAISRSRPRAG